VFLIVRWEALKRGWGITRPSSNSLLCSRVFEIPAWQVHKHPLGLQLAASTVTLSEGSPHRVICRYKQTFRHKKPSSLSPLGAS